MLALHLQPQRRAVLRLLGEEERWGVDVPPPNIHPQTPAPSDSGPDVALRPIS